MEHISILILAAGNSSRMGGKLKQLLPWRETTLLGHAIQEAKKVSERVTVVLGAHADTIQEHIPAGVDTIVNPHWGKGMGSSISFGTKHLIDKKPTNAAILIMLGDQPFLEAVHLRALLNRFNSGTYKIVGTSYGDRLGVPAIFEGSLAGELSLLDRDHGARHIIERHSNMAMGVVPIGKEMDLDTLEAYDRALELDRGFPDGEVRP